MKVIVMQHGKSSHQIKDVGNLKSFFDGLKIAYHDFNPIQTCVEDRLFGIGFGLQTVDNTVAKDFLPPQDRKYKTIILIGSEKCLESDEECSLVKGKY